MNGFLIATGLYASLCVFPNIGDVQDEQVDESTGDAEDHDGV